MIKNLFWFQPLLWLGHSLLAAQREQACDDEVMASGTTAATYADVLLQLTRELVASRSSGRTAGALAVSEPPVATRIQAILQERQRGDLGACGRTAIWIAVLFCAFSLSTIRSVAEPVYASQQETEAATERKEETEPTSQQIPKTLSGKLVDENGIPIDQANIQLGISSQNQPLGISSKVGVWKTMTDARGKFRFEQAKKISNLEIVWLRSGNTPPNQGPSDVSLTRGVDVVYDSSDSRLALRWSHLLDAGPYLIAPDGIVQVINFNLNLDNIDQLKKMLR